MQEVSGHGLESGSATSNRGLQPSATSMTNNNIQM